MIRNFLLILSAIIVYSCSSEQPKNGFIIRGSITNFEDQYLYYPKDFVSKRNAKMDSVFVDNGQFELTGSVDHPVFFSVRSNAKAKFYASFVIENSEIFMNADAALNYDDENRLQVKGSVSDSIQQHYRMNFSEAMNEYGGLKEDQVNNLISKLEDRIQEYPNHWMSLYAANDLCYLLYSGGNHQNRLEYIISLLKPKFENETIFKNIEEFRSASEKRKIGETFIPYAANTSTGERFEISQLFGESYVFVDCWASWCGPCRNEMPELKQIHDRYKSQGFKVLSISFDSNNMLWKNAIKDDQIEDFINISELSHYSNIITETYRINRIPDNFLLDKNGRIVANGLSLKELDEFLIDSYK